ncbi:MAG: hypothetical protein UV61_C0006G0143 [Candidatus Gottesmanbacteria bacterium GW2011_GWB1_43_11]|uniref:Uncharacterized protein n=1 Tax=Candidatus Gottesmanbacteria bacterium GW2011_GWB1_43_11 TaxID=1618446 RepID=A0A0G1CN74_9BACT|nr:MAG: hypothetical protein UV04_C0005G0143 [Candidatus Gottesmanbacteria bacterium GW2011_GWA2_42_16]KKS55674.1 MAG: hypothetical protein UV17_C0008G0025 [Candidatus Gottesmanbacteria bacterium GW2011_GWA1_42_26]KKS81475.1 MAG: hypothetical protein UV55_C0013G0017 [Candidatus Gottesmanbacteria bacterium GW2011_GWC1_43_10]KKS86942.1 MAG: hypothetical protein UV61_C0006G0143 [Candidatus Gottesmanbacteria bacterium GW2011_GWB1_43_11]OGG09514.1 MAG: hypothetical protein A2699_03170 [Candidatus Go
MQSKDLLIISIVTLITVFAWIAFDVYHAASSSSVSPTQELLMTELNPKFDINTINSIRQLKK